MYDSSGQSVSSAGDVNGDGYDDILIGALEAHSNGKKYAGESYVVYGAATSTAVIDLAGLNGTNGFTLTGVDTRDFSGQSVSSAGDVNGDGYDDILIGASGADHSTGETYVVYGAATSTAAIDLADLNGTNGFTLSGIDMYDSSGQSVSSAGDVNGDGYDDILIGASGADHSTGESYVVYGGAARLSALDAADGTSDGHILLAALGLTLVGTTNPEVLNGGIGPDLIDARAGNDTLRGQGGNDTLNGQGGADLLFGQAGYDLLDGGFANDVLFGGDGDDTLLGGDSTDTLYGDAGADLMDGGENSDIYFVDGLDRLTDSGGAGYDKAQIDDVAGVALSLSGWSGVERVNGFAGNDTLDASNQGTDLFLFGNGGGDRIVGGTANDTLIGGTGDDTLIGGAGNDVLMGSAGSNTFNGGAGDDLFFIGAAGDVIQNAGPGFDKVLITVATGLSIDVGAWLGVERINGLTGDDAIDAAGMTTAITLAGGAGNDTLTGGIRGDTFFAGAGDDLVLGGAGDDTLYGGSGADLMDGGENSDIYFVDGLDRLTDSGAAGYDKAQVIGAAGVTLNLGTWSGIERVNGLTGDDAIDATGMTTAITLVGGDGNDTLTGGSADDTFYAGAGDDLMLGSSGADALIGSTGNDTLEGGVGKDFYLGGLGVDSFAWAPGFGRDVVQDYVDGVDRLDFSDHSGVNSLADLSITQSGANTILRLGIGGIDQITLVAVTATDLGVSDFDFV